jgi:hypothetical protein
MNKHLAIICALPTALFLFGVLLIYLDAKWPIPDNKAIRNGGILFMVGAIVIVLQVMYSLYGG